MKAKWGCTLRWNTRLYISEEKIGSLSVMKLPVLFNKYNTW